MKTKIRSVIPSFLGVVGIVLGGLALVQSLSTPAIAVVHLNDLIFQYTGMKEAQETYKVKQESWEREADSLDQEFQEAINRYQGEKPKLSAVELHNRQREIGLLQQSLTEHKSKIAETAAMEDRELTEGVLVQITTFVEEYGKQHNYDVILGTNGAGEYSLFRRLLGYHK